MPTTAASVAIVGTNALDLVATDTFICDGRHQHEIVAVTDGARVYAYGLTSRYGQTEVGSRSGTVITVACPVPDDPEDGDLCGGEVRIDLTTPGIWQQNHNAAADLANYGGQVEL